MSLAIEKILVPATGQPSRPPEVGQRLNIAVVFSSVDSTLAAFQEAGNLANSTLVPRNIMSRRNEVLKLTRQKEQQNMDPTLGKTPMKLITRLVMAAAVMFGITILCPAQDVKPTDLGKGAAFNGKTIEMKDKGEVDYLLSFTAGKEFEATTDGLKNTDVRLFVYDSSGEQVAKDDSPGPKCSVKVTPKNDGQYKFVIKNAGGANTVTFKVKVAK